MNLGISCKNYIGYILLKNRANIQVSKPQLNSASSSLLSKEGARYRKKRGLARRPPHALKRPWLLDLALLVLRKDLNTDEAKE